MVKSEVVEGYGGEVGYPEQGQERWLISYGRKDRIRIELNRGF